MTEIKAIAQVVTDTYAIYHGDSCEILPALPPETVGFSLHSPPFEGLYKFSNSDRDLSNSEGAAFWHHYAFIIAELFRLTKPGRLCAVHCMQLPTSKRRDGFIGMRDFRGDIIRAYQKAGWLMHSEVAIRKDPVSAQHRTKSIRLLHKQVVKDKSISGQVLLEYIVVFRKPGDNAEPIPGAFDRYVGPVENEPPRAKFTTSTDARNWYSIEVWQRYAEAIWLDIRQGRVLSYQMGRDDKDEAHISPLQLDVIERCIHLWSNPGDTVLTPFLGIGSEVYGAVQMDRRGIGIELKETYFRQARRNLENARAGQPGMFEVDDTADSMTAGVVE